MAKELADWWGDGEFHRTPASGGLRWKSSHRIHGDLACPGSFPWQAPELKHREDWSLDDAFAAKKTAPLHRYWKDAIAAAKRAESEPLLVLRRNRYPVLLVMRAKSFLLLCGRFDEFPSGVPHVVLHNGSASSKYGEALAILRFSDLKRWLNPRRMRLSGFKFAGVRRARKKQNVEE